MNLFEDSLPMFEKVVITRYLAYMRNHPRDNSNDQYWICGYLAERMISTLSAEELPEFLVSNDSLIRECTQGRLDELLGKEVEE